MPQFKQFKVIAFDTMGTLLDQKKGISQAIEAFLPRLSPGTTSDELYEAFGSAIAQLMSTEGPLAPYASLQQKAITKACFQLSSGACHLTSSEASTFADSLVDWPPFPDTVASLQLLASKGYKLILVSNMETEKLQSIADKPTGSLKDVPLSALRGYDVSKAFKPDHKVINSLLDAASKDFGAAKDEVLIVAQGLSSDHVPAFELGVASAWIDRYGQGRDAIPSNARPDWVFSSAEELCKQVEEEFKDGV
jgi:2-haloalkanoic acid dehalogenase type II